MTDAVILIHGLWMFGPDMSLLRRRLRRCGFTPYQFSYPSRHWTVSEAAARLQGFTQSVQESTVHFVAHSLGGLVVYRMAHDFPGARPGRIVTLGSPHQGCAVAQRLARNPIGRFLLGKSFPRGLSGEARCWTAPPELAVIAGNLGVGGGRFIGGLATPNDGTVAVAETYLPGLKEHAVVRVSHMGLLISPQVAQMTCAFLRNGRFDEPALIPPARGSE